MLKSLISTFIGLVLSFPAQGQMLKIHGKVVDKESGHPLPFVNVVVDTVQQGVATDIDGLFSVKVFIHARYLTFSYVGYKTQKISLQGEIPSFLLIQMQKSDYNLAEFVVSPGINPANKIIKKVIENKNENNPEHCKSFTYKSYNKMIFTADYDSMYFNDMGKRNSLDSSDQKVIAFLDKHHLMMMEFVSERSYLRPDYNYEKVIASRISGLKIPTFSLLATQMQSFSFYPDFINIYDKYYLNPISTGSLGKYSFTLEDTTYRNSDSVFIISFRPKKNKTFDAMQGLLYINTHGYAIQNVIAEPVFKRKDGIFVRIRQAYELIDDMHWFPVKLNTEIVYGMLEINNGHKIVGIGKSYLSDIKINPELNKKRFKETELEMSEDAGNKTDDFWDTYRENELDAKEEKTYQFVDSIGREAHFDRKIFVLTSLLNNQLPLKYVNLDLNQLVNYNEYEGFRLGCGLHSSKNISNRFSFGGYWAYGFRDMKYNYGGDFALKIWKKPDLKINVFYYKDVVESGGSNFVFEHKSLFNTSSYRDFLVERMDNIENAGCSFELKPFKYMQLQLGLSNQVRHATNDYIFNRIEERSVSYLEDIFYITEAEINLRYVYKERFGNMRGEKFSLGTKYPVIMMRFARGFDNFLGGRYDYIKTELKIRHDWITRIAGRFSTSLTMGTSSGIIPYTLLFNARGNTADFSLFSEGSFETMGLNEFLSDQYIAFNWSHHIYHLTGKGHQFRPELVLVNNAIIGSLKNPEKHLGIDINSLEKGYFESGLLINELLRMNFSGFGLGVFYRYGYYAMPDQRDNLYFKLSLTVNI